MVHASDKPPVGVWRFKSTLRTTVLNVSVTVDSDLEGWLPKHAVIMW